MPMPGGWRLEAGGWCRAEPRLYTVKILVVILTTISWLTFITTLSSLPLDDTVVTRVISIGNWNLRDEPVTTNDERVVN